MRKALIYRVELSNLLYNNCILNNYKQLRERMLSTDRLVLYIFFIFLWNERPGFKYPRLTEFEVRRSEIEI